MDLTEELTKELKKKVKTILNKNNTSPDTSTNAKNVSWAELGEYEHKPKINLRFTPYPNPTKKMKISSSTPKTLTFFEDSGEEEAEKYPFEENLTSPLPDPPNIFKELELCKPRKRTEYAISASSSEWTVTTCKKIKPAQTNKQCNNENITLSSEESNSEDEETFISEDKYVLKHDDIFFESSNESIDLIREQVKPKIKNLNKRSIIKAPVENNSNTSEDNLENGSCSYDDSESKIINTDNISDIIPKPKIRFDKIIKSYISETDCILIVKHPLKFYFHGKLYLSVLYGAVEILGHILRFDNKKEFEIYSPKGQSYLCLETVESTFENKEMLHKILSEYRLPKIPKIKVSDCVIAIRSLNNNLSNYLSTHVAQYLFPKPVQCEKYIEKKLHCLFELENTNWKVYKKNDLWTSCLENAVYNLSAHGFSCTMLCGGKSVGKSTLFRYMTNSLLNESEKVVCIDLDLGQAEFTIAGCVSVTIVDKPIFGPNFTHLKTPLKNYFIGDVNLTNCVDRYITSVKELLMFCYKNIDKKYPWIVNFMGFSKSFGVDLTVATIKLVCPTTVVQINSSMKNRNYPAPLTTDYVQNYIYSFPIITPSTEVNYNLIELNSFAEDKIEGEFKLEAKDLREIAILSYFSQMVEIGKEITSAVPYSVKLSSIKLVDLSYNKENILAVLNGNLVALCKTNAETIDKQTALDCLGFGIVRGVDRDTGELYLLTPVAENELENVNCLIRGCINIPPSLYMTKGRQGLVPYILLGTQQGTSSIPKRSYKNLKSLFKKK